jgi:DNA-binding IclR family transcriptional regulator
MLRWCGEARIGGDQFHCCENNVPRVAKISDRRKSGVTTGDAIILRGPMRALSIFDCFLVARESLPLGFIATRIGLAKSTTSRLVRTLEALGYLVQLEDDRYMLSDKFLDLAGLVHSTRHLHDTARPIMEQLAERAGECVTLNALVGDQRVCIEAVNVTQSVAGATLRGEPRPLGLGAASLVLMAYQSRDVQSRLIRAVARSARYSRIELASIVTSIKKQGYAVSHGGSTPDVSGIAAPVFDRAGSVRCCLAVVLSKRLVRGRVGLLTGLVSDAAAELSVDLLS